jgi:hypothetical protein
VNLPQRFPPLNPFLFFFNYACSVACFSHWSKNGLGSITWRVKHCVSVFLFVICFRWSHVPLSPWQPQIIVMCFSKARQNIQKSWARNERNLSMFVQI